MREVEAMLVGWGAKARVNDCDYVGVCVGFW